MLSRPLRRSCLRFGVRAIIGGQIRNSGSTEYLDVAERGYRTVLYQSFWCQPSSWCYEEIGSLHKPLGDQKTMSRISILLPDFNTGSPQGCRGSPRPGRSLKASPSTPNSQFHKREFKPCSSFSTTTLASISLEFENGLHVSQKGRLDEEIFEHSGSGRDGIDYQDIR